MRRALLLCLLSVAVLVGCGNSRTPVPNPLAPAAPKGFRAVSLPTAGVSLSVPRNWTTSSGRAPLLTVISSGSAVIAVWRYPRSGAAPADVAAVAQALIKRARTRDPNLELISSKVLRAGNHPAIEMQALERIAGQLRNVRSTHIFLANAEVVLDEYAPPYLFAAVDKTVFAPVARSLLAMTAA